MTILVDDARWPWRGTTWCHLVTDSQLGELHDFARRLGCRRIGFQGDHYDIDVDVRRLAVEGGAVECSSRELVRRLRAAGLRLRPSQFEKWSLRSRWDGPAGLGLDDHISELGGPTDRRDLIMRADDVSTGGFVVVRSTNTALIVHGEGSPPVGEDADTGVYSRVDHLGRWALEVLARPLPPAE